MPIVKIPEIGPKIEDGSNGFGLLNQRYFGYDLIFSWWRVKAFRPMERWPPYLKLKDRVTKVGSRQICPHNKFIHPV